MSLAPMLYIPVSLDLFTEVLKNKAPDSFSTEGARILYDHLFETTEEATKLDVAAITSTYEEVSETTLIQEKELFEVDDVLQYLKDEGLYIGRFHNPVIIEDHYIIRVA